MPRRPRHAAIPPDRPGREAAYDPAPLRAAHFTMGDRYHILRSRGTDTWLLFYTVGGGGFFRSADGRTAQARAGTLHLYPPRVGTEYGTLRGGTWDFHWVHFSARPAWAGWLKLPGTAVPGLLEVPVRSARGRARILDAFRDLHRDIRMGGLWRAELASNAIERILIVAGESVRAGRGRPVDDRIQAVLERIATRPAERYTVAGLAASVHVSPSRFAHLFRRETGHGVIEAILHARLAESAKLLELTPTPIKEIAAMTGFGSPHYFSARFKKRFGMGPRAFRRKRGVEPRNS